MALCERCDKPRPNHNRRWCSAECRELADGYARWGAENPAWKGDAAEYSETKRCRAQRRYILGKCDSCGKPAFDRHHRDGNTGNNEPFNIGVLCRRCHMLEDGRLQRFIEMARAPKLHLMTPPKPCATCGKPSKPLRRGDCHACNERKRRAETKALSGQLARRPSKGVGRGFAVMLALLMLACCGTNLDADVEAVRSEIDAAFARRGVQTVGEIQTYVGAGAISGSLDGITITAGGEAAIVVEDVEPFVIAHEFGHAMGLSHEDDPSSIMYRSAPKLSAPEAAEQLAELCLRHQCAKVSNP